MNQVGIGTRVINFIADTLLVIILSFIFNKVWDFYVIYWGYPYINPLLSFGGMLFIYYFIFELFWAKTPGKWLSYTKVVDKKGLKPGFIQIFLRSIVRLTIIDCFFIPFLNKPLHDYVSSTEVIEV
ncbi:RDD family protein [Panacibacter ginsenosidivorans]|uniref:RDD family protein n=1 Tax=Panacibacter ginsenosidivorans TaxID=1813871 RepID=A0A5B8V5J9_9BACT|nr:RDD family protein [Panacibacter ginsenosidivorans]QEC65876.1 RDD family protein [Panacibacter ginsenosidivorans]